MKKKAAEQVVEAKFTRHFVLGGKVVLHQNDSGGHKAGLDAVMLAASVGSSDIVSGAVTDRLHVVDLGAGVGTAGLCVAARLQNVSVTLVENDPSTLVLANSTITDLGNISFSDRVSVLDADVNLRGEERVSAGLKQNMADHVIMNPPYWSKNAVRLSPDKVRASAHVLGEDDLTPWFRTAAGILRDSGKLSVILPAERLGDLLEEMKGRFGDIRIFPLYKGEKETAIRVIAVGTKGSRSPMQILRGLVLHEAQIPGVTRRNWTLHANAILKGEASLFI